MATRPSTQPPNRQGYGNGGGGNRPDSDLGNVAIARMAREDTRWFIAAVIVLSLVLFLALPLSMLLVIDHMRLQSQIKAEVKSELKEIRKLKKEIEDMTKTQKE